MVVIEKKRNQHANRQRYENPLDRQIPEIYQPTPVHGRVERFGGWQSLYMYALNVSRDVGESDPEDGTDLDIRQSSPV